MRTEDYIIDPCNAASLPFWKEESISLPENIKVLRDDEFNRLQPSGSDDKYFKMIYDLKTVTESSLPVGFELIQAEVKDFANHINTCYELEHVTAEELMDYKSHPVYSDDLWIAVMDSASKQIVATGIAEFDSRIGEGILEWIQVSPEYRKRGLGKYIVCELSRRLQGKADFVTVSGRVDNKSNPFELYKACGFCNPVIWHIVTRKKDEI